MAEIEELSKNLELSKLVETSFLVAKQKLDKRNLMLAKRIVEIETTLETTESEANINACSADAERAREELLSSLILTGKVSEILERNKERQAHIHSIEKLEGYDLSLRTPSKKELDAAIAGMKYDITLENLGLANSSPRFLNFKDKILYLVGGKLDCTNADNIEALKSFSADSLEKLLSQYPEIVKDIDVSALLDENFRLKFLNAVASFIFGELKVSSVSVVNEKLGNLLMLRRQEVTTFETYMDAVYNFFKVKIKMYLQKNNPDLSAEIDEIPCNEYSPLLPDELYKLSAQRGGTMSDRNLEIAIDELLKNLTSV